MKPVFQTIYNLQTGNCMQACVASIFELPLESVPNFMVGGHDHFRTHLKRWCDNRGLVALDISFNDRESRQLIYNCYVIAIGKARQASGWDDLDPEYREFYKNAQHGVVWHFGEMVHDSFPGGNGLKGKPELFTVFIMKDPSKLNILT